ncbi:glycosyltransferase family 4 protein [Myxosarcina sp. GI1(2024)]
MTATIDNVQKLNIKYPTKKLKLGVIANEFFDLSVGRMGGFGWATRQVAKCFSDPSLGVEVVFLSGELTCENHSEQKMIHGVRLIPRQSNRWANMLRLWQEKIDVLLAIDYRLDYRYLLKMMPTTPVIIWVRDPRTPEDVAKIHTIRIPGQEDRMPQGLNAIDCTSLADVVKQSRWFNRPVLFGTPASFLRNKVKGTYGIENAEVAILPNIIDIEPGEIVKSEKPTVVFLARLDPYKRPWLFVELARRFREVEFIFLGKPHFRGEGAWEHSAPTLPDNVRLLGHVQGQEKIRLLSQAWVLINTSIHEGLAVSFQEALKCETPILSSVNPERVVEKFGIYVGHWTGSGMEGLPKFEEGLRQLLTDKELRIRLGKEGRQWVEQTHSKTRFLEAFQQLCSQAGVKYEYPDRFQK